MELLPRATTLHLVLLIICYLVVCRAQDCGNNQVARSITVDQSGKTKFRTVQAAIDSIPENNNQWMKIHINAGTYTYVTLSIYFKAKLFTPPLRFCFCFNYLFFFFFIVLVFYLLRVMLRVGRRSNSPMISHASFWKAKAETSRLLHTMATNKQMKAPHSLRPRIMWLQRALLLR